MAGCHAGHGIGGTGVSSFYAYGSQRQRLSVSPVFVLPGLLNKKNNSFTPTNAKEAFAPYNLWLP